MTRENLSLLRREVQILQESINYHHGMGYYDDLPALISLWSKRQKDFNAEMRKFEESL